MSTKRQGDHRRAALTPSAESVIRWSTHLLPDLLTSYGSAEMWCMDEGEHCWDCRPTLVLFLNLPLQWRRQAWARGPISSPKMCRLALSHEINYTGQESGSKLCEVFKFWLFLQWKSVNNVCKLFQLLGVRLPVSVIFVNENENENGEKRENNEFVNEN